MTFSRSSAPLTRSHRSQTSGTPRFQQCRSRRGSTLASALLLVATAALVSVVALQRGLASWRLQSSSTSQKIAFYMAEAGLAEARDDLTRGGSGNVGTRELPAVFGSGAFWVETITDEHGVAFITSTGLAGATATRLSQAVHQPPLPLVELGFFGQFGVDIGNNTIVREYTPVAPSGGGTTPNQPSAPAPSSTTTAPAPAPSSPTPAPAPSQPTSEPAPAKVKGKGKSMIALAEPPPLQTAATVLLGSDAGIALGAGTSVAGTALPGPDQIVNMSSGSSVTGSTLPERESRDLLAIRVPLDKPTGTLDCFAFQTKTLASGTHVRTNVTISSYGTLKIVGPASVSIERLSVGGSGKLLADTSAGAVHVYVSGTLVVSQGAVVRSESGDASKFVLLFSGRGDTDTNGDGIPESQVTWSSSAPACLALYAPYSAVTLPNGIHWIGGLAAQSLHIGDNSLMELDSRLNDVKIASREHKLKAWRVLRIRAAEKALLRRDIVKLARLRGDVLPRPSEARVPATTEFLFETPEGKKYRYKGVSLLDLTEASVASVLPLVADVEAVPPFAKYSDDAIDEVADVVSAEFQNAWDYALGHFDLSAMWPLVTGVYPSAVWQAVVVDGVSVEPYAAVFNDPNVKKGLEIDLATSWLPMKSKQFITAVIANGP